MSTDTEWERWGAKDPYFGVLTAPRFRSAVLTPAVKEEFFYSGRCHVSHVLDTCRRVLDPAFVPRRVLDFGCGVGRMLIPFAEGAEETVGVDISPSMLAQARLNCEERGARNVVLALSDDTLSQVEGQFDLVHTAIVLQHIEVVRGRALFAVLVDRVRPGGIGVLHATFAWDYYASNHGQAPAPLPIAAPPADAMSQAKAAVRRLIQPLRAVPEPPPAPPPEPDADPEMQMNYYNLSELLFIIQRAGVQRMYTEFTDHGGALGVFMYFQKQHALTESVQGPASVPEDTC